MIDREKQERIISHLQILRTWCAVNPDYEKGLSIDDCHKAVEWLDDALDLLKAQEPVKPVFDRQFMSDIGIYDCGKCGTSLGVEGIAKYCMNCGQAVKWE